LRLFGLDRIHELEKGAKIAIPDLRGGLKKSIHDVSEAPEPAYAKAPAGKNPD